MLSITDDMIEAAAIAIRTKAAARSTAHRHMKPKQWDDLPATLKASYRDEALAALQAIGLIRD